MVNAPVTMPEQARILRGEDEELPEEMPQVGANIKEKPLNNKRKGKMNINFSKNVFCCNYCGESGFGNKAPDPFYATLPVDFIQRPSRESFSQRFEYRADYKIRV